MAINSISTDQLSTIQSMKPMKPAKPQAPTPPAGGNSEDRQEPPEPAEPSAPTKPISARSGGTGVNYTALRSFQVIIGDYDDVSTLGTDKRNELNRRLQSAGLLTPGALLDTKA